MHTLPAASAQTVTIKSILEDGFSAKQVHNLDLVNDVSISLFCKTSSANGLSINVGFEPAEQALVEGLL